MSFSSHCQLREHRRGSVLVLFIVVALLGGCGARLDSPPPGLPSASVDQTWRNTLVSQLTALESATNSLLEPAKTMGADVALQQAGQLAKEQLTRFGGQWVPWPNGKAKGSDPGPSPLPVPADLPAFLALLIETQDSARQGALAAQDAAFAMLCAATAVSLQQEITPWATLLNKPVPTETMSFAPTTEATAGAGKNATSNLLVLDACRWYTQVALSHYPKDQHPANAYIPNLFSKFVENLLETNVADTRPPAYDETWLQLNVRTCAPADVVKQAVTEAQKLFLSEVGNSTGPQRQANLCAYEQMSDLAASLGIPNTALPAIA